MGYVYEDDNDIYDDDERKTMSRISFDSDVLEEIKTSYEEMNKMVSEFKTKFGHDLPATNEEEIEFRDPIVTASTIRKFRALDEQLKESIFLNLKNLLLGIHVIEVVMLIYLHLLGKNN